ncbi:PAS domain S-box protein [Stieleria sp. JC731]|uniref:chemotaxis protein CheB n=1 Tax=Pirellulaceae TaxID=2691357 RepID=UPI001E3E8CFB|nr:chemotaxis protein CheB [Stieleria sp. JC731]MCC9599106.1 PAS domain S-box protein [Stieleria sp. JC731]
MPKQSIFATSDDHSRTSAGATQESKEHIDVSSSTDEASESGSSSADTSSSTDEDCEDSDDACQHHIVAIGASAGGLEALESFFKSAATDAGISYVVIQHLSPDFESHMDSLLGRMTDLPVKVVKDRMPVEPNHIYLIPAKTEMIVSEGKLLLTERPSDRIVNHPIDLFFRSLAQDIGRYSIGVIMSGTGSDGSKGVREISEVGGLVISQDPSTCKFDSMPLNAQETGCVDLILPPDTIPNAIVRYVANGEPVEQLREQFQHQDDTSGLDHVFHLLQTAHDIDFSSYKPGTVHRRIQRRMEMLDISDLSQYVTYLRENGNEVNDLYKDLLIGVTRFFRDTESFELLTTHAFPKLIEQIEDSEFRAWVCGCASGEEAYSIAILLNEAYERAGRQPNFKIFATDAHQESLQFAAAGIYDAKKIETLPERYRAKYFRKRRDGFYVTPELRRHIVFAPHNVVSDPPFTQMHLVTCRNLLIYLQPTTQRKALSLLHFALCTQGILFLGPSESPGDLADEFDSLQKGHKIYRKRRDLRLPTEVRMPIARRHERRGVSPFFQSEQQVETRNDILPSLYDTLLGKVMPPSILIDENNQVLHTFAGSEPFLKVVIGRPTTNVLEMIYPAARNSLSAAIQHTLRGGEPVRYSGLPHPSDPSREVRLIVEPIKLESNGRLYLLVQFEDMQAAATSYTEAEYHNVDIGTVAAARIETLEQDLSYTQQNLQATIEELETSNEELQATNEEMVAANEELTSTNEELHSVNEELYTVNAEHQKRVKELDESNTDMQNLLATTHVGVLFLDRELQIRRYTPAFGKLLYLESQDIGRKIENFLARVADDTFIQQVNTVLDERREIEWEVTIADKVYFTRAIPYWTGSEVDGVVISLVDISSRKETEADLEQFKFMADASIDAQALIDEQGQITYANEQLAKLLNTTVEDTVHSSILKIDNQLDQIGFGEAFSEARNKGGLIYETTLQTIEDSIVPVEIALTYVTLREKGFLFAAIRDITERKQAESRRRLLEQAIETVETGVVISDPTKDDNPITFANTGFEKITGYSVDEILGRNCRLMQGAETDPDDVQKLRTSIKNHQSCRTTIRNHRKNGEPFWNDLHITPVKDNAGETIAYVGIQTDVTERIEASLALERNERMTRLLLNSTAEGIFGMDQQGTCTFCNQTCVRMLGYSDAEELIGKDIHDAIHHTSIEGDTINREDSMMHRALRQSESDHADSDQVFWRADGTSFPVEYWIHPLIEKGISIGAVVTFVDITKRREEERRLRHMQREADAANAAKSRFLANMSHELRTPLSAILGFTQIVDEEIENEEVRDKLATIKRNGEYLLRLLNDVLDLSRIESGKFSTDPMVIRLDEFLTDIEQTMQMRAIEFETELKVELENPLPESLNTDPARLRQILINLTSNSIKFAAGGHAKVVVRHHQRDDGQWMEFEVSDDGIGMSQEQVDRLFEPFTQASQTIHQRFGGTGLGLSICQRLAKALSGTIEVESREGEGSSFRVTLPVDPATELKDLKLGERRETDPLPQHQSSDDRSIAGSRILIADDRRDIRYIAQHFLSKAGCLIETAENGRQAVDKVIESHQTGQPFNLVLMDIQMPILNGMQAIEEIRNRDLELPVIALTADAMKGTRRKLISLGFDEYLTKPISSKVLLSTVERLLHPE